MAEKRENFLRKENLLTLGLYDELYSIFEFIKDKTQDAFNECESDTEAFRLYESYPFYDEEYQLIKEWVNKNIRLFTAEFDSVYIKKDYVKFRLRLPYFKHTKPLQLKLTYITFNEFTKNLQEIIIESIKDAYLSSHKPRASVILRDIAIDRIENQISNKKVLLTVTDEKEKNILISCQGLIKYKNLIRISCNQKKHDVVPAICNCELIDESGIVTLPVHRCNQCDKLFIGIRTLNEYQKQFGIMFIPVVYDNATDISRNIYYGEFGESKLHSLGYNVVEGEMSTSQRRQLLKYLLKHKKITYFEICRDIENAIELFENHRNFLPAIKKWKSDLLFIGEYVKNTDK